MAACEQPNLAGYPHSAHHAVQETSSNQSFPHDFAEADANRRGGRRELIAPIVRYRSRAGKKNFLQVL